MVVIRLKSTVSFIARNFSISCLLKLARWRCITTYYWSVTKTFQNISHLFRVTIMVKTMQPLKCTSLEFIQIEIHTATQSANDDDFTNAQLRPVHKWMHSIKSWIPFIKFKWLERHGKIASNRKTLLLVERSQFRSMQKFLKWFWRRKLLWKYLNH